MAYLRWSKECAWYVYEDVNLTKMFGRSILTLVHKARSSFNVEESEARQLKDILTRWLEDIDEAARRSNQEASKGADEKVGGEV